MSHGWDIVEACRVLLVAANITDVGSAGVIIQDDSVHDVLNTRTRSIILVGEDDEEIEEQTSKGIQLAYPVLVLLVMERGLRPEQSHWRKDTRQAIRQVLHVARLPGAATTCNVVYEGRPGFSPASWQDAFRVSAQRFTWTSSERRNG